MREEGLSFEYLSEFDQIDQTSWSKYLGYFSDANFYQTWSYGAVRWGEKCLRHLVLKKGTEVVSIAQVRIVRIPILSIGMAYVYRGPIWKLRGRELDQSIFREAIYALRNEYVSKQGLFLRILPNEIEEDGEYVFKVLKALGFKKTRSGDRTIIAELTPSLDEFRKGLRKQWRQTLAKAEREKFDLLQSTDSELFQEALIIYKKMHARKGFAEFVNMSQFEAIQKKLPSDLKMKIMISKYEGDAVAALAWSKIGDTGLPLIAATCGKALETNASYLLFWKMIEDLKSHGCLYLDLGGINPNRNPGGYVFKSGLAGKYGKEVTFVGQFDLCESFLSSFIIKLGDLFRLAFRRMKIVFNRFQKRIGGLWVKSFSSCKNG